MLVMAEEEADEKHGEVSVAPQLVIPEEEADEKAHGEVSSTPPLVMADKGTDEKAHGESTTPPRPRKTVRPESLPPLPSSYETPPRRPSGRAWSEGKYGRRKSDVLSKLYSELNQMRAERDQLEQRCTKLEAALDTALELRNAGVSIENTRASFLRFCDVEKRLNDTKRLSPNDALTSSGDYELALAAAAQLSSAGADAEATVRMYREKQIRDVSSDSSSGDEEKEPTTPSPRKLLTRMFAYMRFCSCSYANSGAAQVPRTRSVVTPPVRFFATVQPRTCATGA